MHALVNRLWIVALLVALSTQEASAYTDPGSGALLWQLILAAGVGLMFYFRRFLSWFGRKKADD